MINSRVTNPCVRMAAGDRVHTIDGEPTSTVQVNREDPFQERAIYRRDFDTHNERAQNEAYEIHLTGIDTQIQSQMLNMLRMFNSKK